MSYTEKQARINNINYKVNISLNTNILAQCSSYLNNELDINKTGGLFNITCTKVDFKYYLEKNKMKAPELQVILAISFNPFVNDMSEKKFNR